MVERYCGRQDKQVCSRKQEELRRSDVSVGHLVLVKPLCQDERKGKPNSKSPRGTFHRHRLNACLSSLQTPSVSH